MVTNIIMPGMPGMGSGQGESWLEKLLPIAGIALAGFFLWKMLAGTGPGAGTTDGGVLQGGSYGGGDVTTQQDQGAWSSSGNQKGGVVVSPTGFAKSLVDTFRGTGTNNPENIRSGASWTRFAVAMPAANIPAWQPPGLIAVQSGRESPLGGQIAEYNPATGNMWGGALDTVKYLYTAGPSLAGSSLEQRTEAINACRTAECVNALSAASWRETYA